MKYYNACLKRKALTELCLKTNIKKEKNQKDFNLFSFFSNKFLRIFLMGSFICSEYYKRETKFLRKHVKDKKKRKRWANELIDFF